MVQLILNNLKCDGLPYRVSLEKDNRYRQGYRYKYRYKFNGKTKKITSTDMDKLHDKSNS